jgi:hypothetical protein
MGRLVEDFQVRIHRLRALLLFALLSGIVGTDLELLLLDHTEGWQQVIPIVLLAVAVPLVLWHAVAPRGAARPTLLTMMWIFIFSGVLGVGLHYQGNAAFELEMYPEMGGMELFVSTIKGATPVLAPGTMVLLGLVGMAYASLGSLTSMPAAEPQEVRR